MKLHDLRPADGSRQPRTRVGRGIAAGKGKTAGRGTKGQKARAGGGIPAWFEGGQTPLHMRIPKLRGFKNRFKIEYEVVNIGAIGELAEQGAFELEATGKKPAASAPITVNQDILRAVGLVRTLNKPMKILGAGELSLPLFVVADAVTASARAKIEAAGGSVNVLEVPKARTAALGLDAEDAHGAAAEAPVAKAPAAKASAAKATIESAPATSDKPANATGDETPAPKAKASKAVAAKTPKASAKAQAKASGKPAAVEESTADEASPVVAGDDAASVADEAPATEETATPDETPAAEVESPADDADTDQPVPAPEAETPTGDDA